MSLRSGRPRVRGQSASGKLLRNGSDLLLQNPVAVGGSTAFLLTMFFVSANAMWYQPYGHPSALFPTRALKFEAPELKPDATPARQRDGETVIRIEREKAASAPADPTVQKVQSILRELNFYSGEVDGIAGPQTREAVANYRRVLGLGPSDRIDSELLEQLGASRQDQTASVTPVPVSRPDEKKAGAETESAEMPSARGSLVVRVQGGLRAFGNDHIEIDGVMGPQTRQAIREFQSLFGLEVTGEADEVLLAKMRSLGFIH